MHNRTVTNREADCLRLLSDGLSVQSVANEIGTSVSTVEKHLARARMKLGASNSLHAVKLFTNERQKPKSILPPRSTKNLVLETAERIERSLSEREALACLAHHFREQGCDHLLIGMIAEPFGQVTNGARVVESTFADPINQLYEHAGGANRDPVALSIARSRSPFHIGSDQIVQEHLNVLAPKFKNLLHYVLDQGLMRMLVVPNSDPGTGAPFSLTLHLDKHAESEFDPKRPEVLSDIRLLAGTYWNFIKSNGDLRRRSGLSVRQSEALTYVARGFSTPEIAQHMNISKRSVEAQLKAARTALGAKNTSAAIFRASVYGVFM